MGDEAEIHIADNPGRERYEVHLGDELAGFTQYRLRPALIAFVHTEIANRFEGRGLASKLIRFALDDARSRALAVLPFCPFVNAYIQKHPEYVDLVPEANRQQFDL